MSRETISRSRRLFRPKSYGSKVPFRRCGEAMLPYAETSLCLLVAAVLGSLIGFERERLLWAAGIRTHMLVCGFRSDGESRSRAGSANPRRSQSAWPYRGRPQDSQALWCGCWDGTAD
jgi:MgtC family